MIPDTRHVSTRNVLVTCVLFAFAPVAMDAQTPVLRLEPARDSFAHEFTRVSSVRELDDGRLLVVDSRDRTLFVATPASGAVEQLGRTGRGPQEYERPTRLIALSGDSTLLLDPGTRRWLLLAGTRIVGTLAPNDSVVERAGTAVFGADRFDHVVSTSLIDREIVEGDRQRDRVAVRRTNRRTARTDTLLVIRGADARVDVESVSGGVRRNVLELAMSVPEQVLLFPDGWLAVARQRPYRIEWRTASGDSVVGPSLPWADPPVTAAEIELYRQWLEQQLGRNVPAPLVGLAFVDVVSPYSTSALQALPNGSLLISRSRWSGSQGTEYDVVDRRGRLAGQVRLPDRIRIVGVGARHVYTVSVDDDGIETLRRHRWSW